VNSNDGVMATNVDPGPNKLLTAAPALVTDVINANASLVALNHETETSILENDKESAPIDKPKQASESRLQRKD
jgi:hypothetical protein